MKPWKTVEVLVSGAEQSISITHAEEQNGVILKPIDFDDKRPPERVYMDYNEARYFAQELIKWCDEFEPKIEKI